MFETPIAIVGNIVTDPILRRVGDQAVVRFRVASNSRRRTAEGTWEHGDTLYATVNCWGRLVSGTVSSLVKGDPVIVVGQVCTNEYDDREGNPRTSVEVRATAVGPDLARSTARVDRVKRAPDDQLEQASEQVTGQLSGPASASSTDDAVTDGPDEDGRGLPLTA